MSSTQPSGSSSNPPLLSGPPAPGQTQPGPFPDTDSDEPEPYHFLAAWANFTKSIGTGLQGGAYRSYQARRVLRARR